MIVERLRRWARGHTRKGRYSPVGVTFHWTVAALILFQLWWGWRTGRLPVGADKLALSYHQSFETPVVVARPFNTFGPRQSARAIIPTIVSQALTRADIELGDLSPTRDFTFVADTVQGLMRCAEQPGVEGEELNLGTGTEISVRATAEKILAALGRDLPIVESVQRRRPPNSEVDRLVADCSKAERLLGWRAVVGFDEGLERTIEWMRGALPEYKTSIYNV